MHRPFQNVRRQVGQDRLLCAAIVGLPLFFLFISIYSWRSTPPVGAVLRSTISRR